MGRGGGTQDEQERRYLLSQIKGLIVKIRTCSVTLDGQWGGKILSTISRRAQN